MKKNRDDLLNTCESSKKYHSARLVFYEKLYNGVAFFSFATAIAGLTSIIQPYQLQFSLFAVVLVSFIFIFNFHGKIRTHESLYQRFSALNGDIESKAEFQQTDIDNWTYRIHQLYHDEPPVYRALLKHCYNQVTESLYHKNSPEYRKFYYPLRRHQKYLMNLLHFPRIAYDNPLESIKN